MLDYRLATDEQIEYATIIRQILDQSLAPKVKELDKEGTFPVDVLRELAEVGAYGLDIPEKWGGLGFDTKSMCLIYEEMAKVDAGFSLSFHIAAKQWTKVVATQWSDVEKQAYINEILEGKKIGAYCLTEPGAGSDAKAISTTAIQVGDEWIINGTKNFVTNGTVADYYIITAWTDKAKKASQGMTMFLVESGTQGLTLGKKEEKLGLRLSETCDVFLEDVRVPAKNIVGKEGEGLVFGLEELGIARITNMVHVIGVAQAALDYAINYAKERRAFGKRIIDHQGLGFMITDMLCNIEEARALLYHGIDCANAERDVSTLSSVVKIATTEKAVEVCNTAIQILGGYGYMCDYPVEKFFRDARGFAIFEGTNEIQRRTIIRNLAGRDRK